MNVPSMLARQHLVLACVLAAAAVAALILGVRWLAPVPTEGAAGGMTGGMAEGATAMRGESYGGVEVQVPASWGYGTTGWPPCLQKASDSPYVGRPVGGIPLIACKEKVAPLDKRKAYLWFDTYRATPGVRSHDGGWAEETRVVAGVTLTVFTDDAALRERMLDSARKVRETDTYGCPVDHRITTGPDVRPDPGTGGLATVGQVESITVCRYALDRGQNVAPQPVLSASRLTGPATRKLVDAVRAAPEGGGPNEPQNCSADWAFGEEVIVLLVHGEREQEVFVRYSGCDAHGIDDGATLRALTADVVRPLLRGPHAPGGLQGQVGLMVWPRTGTK
ncbi:hypothetical protein ABN034_18000 [Actinopolymorpha sp. B11F2]|uniref:hypothetical protein n=1 Tax=Actinopolymorpha sp. B11F2 TaxID=3160862 RepID=UPI0032E42DF6